MNYVDNAYYANILNGQVDHTDPFLTFNNIPTTQSEGDNIVPQVTVPIGSTTKKQQRAKNFVVEDDMLLVSLWLNVNLNPVHGNEQMSSTYWNRIWEYLMAKKKFTFERTSNSLLHRWSRIQLPVNKFCGYMAKIEGRSQSGVNE
ncbi:PREDICTED: glutathione S-transferase T3-like [Prunus mume]|uniref:Glutathione S-transferase T3-like n=1 Tax=Prunus mume TaxID=102107 RepID=A0ABM0NXK2_PRUMU|nr:PREDICTED: glutathione S-transferase T3-like [Prunus mume]